MLKVNRKVEYGLIALRHMHGKPRENITSVREICNLYGIPFDALAHVLSILNAKGILKSEQGTHGGYRLLENLKNINLAEFIGMIEGQLAWIECARDEAECKCGLMESCNIIGPMHDFNRRLIMFLKSITLDELLQLNSDLINISRKPADSGSSAQPSH